MWAAISVHFPGPGGGVSAAPVHRCGTAPVENSAGVAQRAGGSAAARRRLVLSAGSGRGRPPPLETAAPSALMASGSDGHRYVLAADWNADPRAQLLCSTSVDLLGDCQVELEWWRGPQ